MSIEWKLVCGQATVEERRAIKAQICEAAGINNYVKQKLTNKLLAEMHYQLSLKLEELRRFTGYNLPPLRVVDRGLGAIAILWVDELG